MTQDEYTSSEGLAICGFNGKWKAAQRLALRNERSDDCQLLPYWERVRLIYLELGGEFGDQKYGERQ